MDNKKNVTPFIIAITCALLLWAYIKYKNKIASDELKSNHRYTIGFVYNHIVMPKSSEKIYYHFYFKNIKYSSDYLGGNLEETNGKSFIVKFNPENPKNSEILLDYRVKQGVKHHDEGWVKIPRSILK